MDDRDSAGEHAASDRERSRTLFAAVVFRFGYEVVQALERLAPDAAALRRALWPRGGTPGHLRWDDLMRRWAELERESLALAAARLGPRAPASVREELDAARAAFETRFERVCRAERSPLDELIERESLGRQLRLGDLLTEAGRLIGRAMLDICDAPSTEARWEATLTLAAYFRRTVSVLAFSERLLERPERFAAVDALMYEGARITAVGESGQTPEVVVRPDAREAIEQALALVTRGTCGLDGAASAGSRPRDPRTN